MQRSGWLVISRFTLSGCVLGSIATFCQSQEPAGQELPGKELPNQELPSKESSGQKSSEVSDLPEMMPVFRSVEDGLVASEEMDRPVVVIFTASWCGPCKELTKDLKEKFEKDLLKPSGNSLFRQWVLVQIDVDEREELADRFEVKGVPALRVLDLSEKVLAKTEGYESYAALEEWLKHCKGTATPRVQRALQNNTDLSDVLDELVVLLDDRNADIRQKAILRLSSDRRLTQPSVIDVMQQGSLAQRLCALEILKKWGVDVSSFDPWKPATFQDSRIAALRKTVSKDEPVTIDNSVPKDF